MQCTLNVLVLVGSGVGSGVGGCERCEIAECVRKPRRGKGGVVSNSCQDLLTFFRGLDTGFFSGRDCFDMQCKLNVHARVQDRDTT